MRRRLLAHAWAQTALWLALVLVGNHVASAWFGRFDLTADQRYTLSAVARAEVEALSRPLVAKVYFTEGLQAPYHDHRRAVIEKLEELRAFGRVRVDVVDPTDDPAAQEEARRFGVEPIGYAYRDAGRSETRQVWMGVSLVLGDRQRAISPITATETVEYELVRALHALRIDERKDVAWAIGHGEPDLTAFGADNPLGRLRERLAATHRLSTFALGGDGAVPEEIELLLVVGPQDALPPRAQWQLDQHLMRGGAVGLFLSGVRPDWAGFRTAEVGHGLHGLLGRYGVRVGRDLLADAVRNEPLGLPIGDRVVTMNHPLAPTTRGLVPTAPASRGVDRLVLPFTTTVALADPLPPDVEGAVWAHTEPTAVALEPVASLDPRWVTQKLYGATGAESPVAVGLVGRFRSAFAGRAPPEPTTAGEETVESGATARLLVVGSADLLANNPVFIENAVDWLVEDEALVDVRARATADAPLEPPAKSAAWRWKAAVAGGPLALLYLVPLLRWRRR